MNMINAPHTITTESNQDITIMRRATEILNKDKARERETEREEGEEGRQKRTSTDSSSIVCVVFLHFFSSVSVASRTKREQTLS